MTDTNICKKHTLNHIKVWLIFTNMNGCSSRHDNLFVGFYFNKTRYRMKMKIKYDPEFSLPYNSYWIRRNIQRTQNFQQRWKTWSYKNVMVINSIQKSTHILHQWQEKILGDKIKKRWKQVETFTRMKGGRKSYEEDIICFCQRKHQH